jgi:hypothetical protein
VAKTKSGLVKRYRRRRQKAARSNPSSSPRRNPPVLTDLFMDIGPGFAAFAANRLATRAASVAISKRWPQLAPHAGVIASAATTALAWLGAHRVKVLEPFHTPIILGSAIATGQTVLQTYFPKLGWIVSDASGDVQAPAQQMTVTNGAGGQQVMSPDDFVVTDENDAWYSYNDARDPGPTYTKQRQKANTANAAQTAAQAPAQAAQADDGDDSIFDVLEDQEGGDAWSSSLHAQAS